MLQSFFPLDCEATVAGDSLDLIERELDGLLARHVCPVVEQGPEVEPTAARPKDAGDGLHVLDHVVGSVHEEARHHAVPLVGLSVDFEEVSCAHAEVGLRGQHGGQQVRHSHRPESVVRGNGVRERVHPRVQSKAFRFLRRVEDEAGGEEHKVRELVALCVEAEPRRLPAEAAEASAGAEYLHAGALPAHVLLLVARHLHCRVVGHVAVLHEEVARLLPFSLSAALALALCHSLVALFRSSGRAVDALPTPSVVLSLWLWLRREGTGREPPLELLQQRPIALTAFPPPLRCPVAHELL
mmetsp:Transcript_3455/g.12146  ORF Transcript_3455/g.12146 Transcript_3455/m.12146 type:complete len:298 (+) Transcript_3455:929-1822(+)